MVARAPGRLDVMGGIADYSGSRVLQLPLAQACHVACQLHPPNKQPVWRHVAHRHATAGVKLRPSILLSVHAVEWHLEVSYFQRLVQCLERSCATLLW